MRHLKELVLICSLITLAFSNAGSNEPRFLQTMSLSAPTSADVADAKAAMAAI
jgi:hypothetical protein